jgi:hypothetical protein
VAEVAELEPEERSDVGVAFDDEDLCHEPTIGRGRMSRGVGPV